MSDVKRYDFDNECFYETDLGGDFVLYTDYAALQAKLEIAKELLMEAVGICETEGFDELTLKINQLTATEPTKEPT